MNSRTHNPRFGFTLVEMLVVIGIIASLAAIGSLVIRTGIRSAHKANCLSNLRQIGVGLELYLQDHSQRMPVLMAGRRSRHEDVPVLETVLLEYVESELVFQCPADSEEFLKTGSSYMWNPTQNGLHVTQLSFFNTDDPSRIPLIVDKESWHPGGDGGSSNFLYADRTADNRLRFATAP
ncbi:MAG: type II secretion system protein [Luteolibacter sp.]|jgi:prepilin-type N-terminal cleavage/methylation domain-containing protein